MARGRDRESENESCVENNEGKPTREPRSGQRNPRGDSSAAQVRWDEEDTTSATPNHGEYAV